MIVIGERKGRLVPRALIGKKYWCDCDCGNLARLTEAEFNSLYSCGCCEINEWFDKDSILENMWNKMLDECYKPSCRMYRSVGGRGINVCDEWMLFDVFRRWAITQEFGLENRLIRNNRNMDFTPENCRIIATKKFPKVEKCRLFKEKFEFYCPGLVEFALPLEDQKEYYKTHTAVPQIYYKDIMAMCLWDRYTLAEYVRKALMPEKYGELEADMFITEEDVPMIKKKDSQCGRWYQACKRMDKEEREARAEEKKNTKKKRRKKGSVNYDNKRVFRANRAFGQDD